MSDEPISRLTAALEGRYLIERRLGEGGMATVYLADDVKHHRRVAIKVLRPELAAVLGADRFLSEIRTTAGLQHPHILPLFDSGEAGGFLYYVMPYIDGETLREKLDREKQLGVGEAVEIARDVADALDYAHRQRVIHRDIKPANILLHDGRPVVADFGIALAVSAAGGGRMTETGLSLGTPHYMSPEQASADRDLSARSDVYSLGCVLYEMLAGQPPHTGPSAQSILVHILTKDVTPLTELRHTVPQHVASAVTKAIEKLPADRFETAAAFASALDDEGFSYAVASPPSATPTPTGSAVAARRANAGVISWTIAAVATALALWGWLRPEAPQPVQRLHLDIDVGDYSGRFAAVSPDGSRIVYVGPEQQLYQRSLGALEALPIVGARPARDPFFSPDGGYVGFNYGDGDSDRVASVALSGGSPIYLGDPAGGVSVGGAWLEDGFIYYVTGNNPGGEDVSLVRVPALGGVAEGIEAEAVVVRPAAIEGRTDRLLVVDRSDQVGVGVLDVESGVISPVEGLEDAFEVQHAGGFVFWVTSEGALSAARFDPDRAQLTSTPVTVAQGVARGRFGVSAAGILIFKQGMLEGSGEVPRWVDREGGSQALDGRVADLAQDFDDARLSPDGRYLALEIQRGATQLPDEEHRIVIHDLDQGTSYQLTFEGRFNRFPRWMPDGRLAYVSDRGGRDGIWTQPFDRSGSESLIFETDHDIRGFDVSPTPDGPFAVVLSPRSESSPFQAGIYLVDGGSDEPRPFLATGFQEGAPAISPDGRWIAYQSDETGRMEVYVQSFPEGGRPWPVGSRIGQGPAWGPDGTELFYVVRDGLMGVELALQAGVRVLSETMLLGRGYALNGPGGASYDVASDGRVLAIAPGGVEAVDSSESLPVVVLNVFEELRQRLGEGGA